jgi:hypothetical protein
MRNYDMSIMKSRLLFPDTKQRTCGGGGGRGVNRLRLSIDLIVTHNSSQKTHSEGLWRVETPWWALDVAVL